MPSTPEHLPPVDPVWPRAPTSLKDEPERRLGIIHLMLWTLGSAIILAIVRQFDDGGLPDAYRMPMLLRQTLSAFTGGAALGGLLIWAARLVRGGPRFPCAPGHYLLWIGGWLTLAQWVALGSIELNQRYANDHLETHQILAAVHLVLLTLALYSLLKAAAPWRWRMVIVGLLLLAAPQLVIAILLTIFDPWSVFYLVRWISLGHEVGRAFICVAIVAAVVIDARAGVRRDWLHWTGVAFWLASVAISWGFRLAMMVVSK